MDYTGLFDKIKDNGDCTQSAKMSAYMREQFPFLGIPTPKRRKLCKEYFQIKKQNDAVDWEFIDSCWKEPSREFQYIATDYLILVKSRLTSGDIPKIKRIAVEKSWWDTIDCLDRITGDIALRYPQVNETLIKWSTHENIWLRRIAIDHQLLRKEKTDTQLLEKIVVNNLGQTEFFINKAIGWSLREYGKTNPEWVRDFIERYRDRLAPLSIREASKYL
jgi:3-methyladenine DNA glycosylase AlkD